MAIRYLKAWIRMTHGGPRMARFHILKDVSTEKINLQHFLWMGIPHLPVSGFFFLPPFGRLWLGVKKPWVMIIFSMDDQDPTVKPEFLHHVTFVTKVTHLFVKARNVHNV